MTPRSIEFCTYGFVAAATVLWLGLVPPDLLGQALRVVLAWSLFSTLLVGSAGAWVALRRSLAQQRAAAPHRHHSL